jgi:predicted metal-binding membrane protein
MLVAMMLPTSLPLVTLFRRLVRQRSNHTRLVVLLMAGYLGIWTLFGVIVLIGDLGLHQALEGIEWFEWLEDNAWALGGPTLVLAGLYQFTPLKYHCLDKCRSPLSFIVEHWRGSHEQAQAFRLGVHHGIFCIGCCWSLMLLMFAVGMGNIGWMLVLGTVMAVEKNMPWGRRLSAPLGVALLGWGLILLLVGTLV